MFEDRLAIRIRLIRKETERAIRNGQKLDPRLIRDMSMGRRA